MSYDMRRSTPQVAKGNSSRMSRQRIQNTIKYIEEGLTYKFRVKRHETGGTCSARYCYSVWMRHLIHYYQIKKDIPRVVAEFGPGDTIGNGVAALLCGVEKYYALDFTRYAGMRKIEMIFDQLLKMMWERSPIPDDSEFPGLYPKLKSYSFPDYILTDEILEECLSEERVKRIRSDLRQTRNGQKAEMIHYLAPWWKENTALIKCDMIFSQAVFEHIDDYAYVHQVIANIAEVGAVVSHQIDFGCHGCADQWNGHWAYGDFTWRLVYGTRPYFINRAPLAEHINGMLRSGIKIQKCVRIRGTDGILRRDVSRKYTKMSEKDFHTCGAYVLGIKK